MISWLDAFKKIIGTVQQAGMPATQRPTINFVSGATVVDNPANNSTDVTVIGSGGSGGGQNPNTLTNGLNSNIQTNNLPTLRLSGPSAAFSVGGFLLPAGATPTPGTVLTVINTTSQPMTILPGDAGSTAKYRISTQSGAPFIMPARPSTAVFVYDGSTSLWVLQNQGEVQPLVTHHVRDYGAVGNGNFQNPSDLKWYVDSGHTIEAADDSAAIASAIAAATADIAAGATAHVMLFGNHYIKTPQVTTYGGLAQYAFFVVPSNCTIDGGGSSFLRLGPGLNAMSAPNNGGWAMLAAGGDVNNVTISGIRFDGNGQSGSPVTQANSFISFTGNASTNITIDGCLFYNQSGLNAVFVAAINNGTAGQNVRVTNNSWVAIGNNAALEDHVDLYLQAEGITISGNNFFNDPAVSTVPRNNGQAIQMQAIGATVTGNTFTNHSTAVTFGSAFSGPNFQSGNISIVGNAFYLCSAGVTMFQAVGLTLSDITIVGNTFTIQNDEQGQQESAVSLLDINGSNGFGVNRLNISNNTMFYSHNASWADSDPIAISLSGIVTSCTIANNVIEKFPNGAIVVSPTAASNPNAPAGIVATADLKIYDLKIVGNTIKDCGLVSTEAMLVNCDTTEAATQRLQILNNHISSTGSALSIGMAVVVAGDSITIAGNVSQNVTTPLDYASTNGVTNLISVGVIGDNGTTTALGKSGHTVTFVGQPLFSAGQYLEGGGAPIGFIGVDGNGNTRISPFGDSIVIVGAPAALGSAAVGDLLMAQGKALRFASAGSSHVAATYNGSAIQIAPADPLVLGASGQSVGFYGGSPAAQASRAGQLTDSTGGTPSSTIASAGTIFNEGTLNNNFASLAQRINALETIIYNLGLSA